MAIDAACVMTQQVISVGPDDTVAHVAQTLARHGISGAPVCDQAGEVLGMISEGDLLQPFALENRLSRSWWLSLLADAAGLAPAIVTYLQSDCRCARDLMTHPAIVATEHTTLPEIVDLLQRHHVKRVAILRDSKLVGVVSRADVISALHNMPGIFAAPPAQRAPIGSTDPFAASLASLAH